jgi:uncharacterized delta-60 repeat protein
MLRLARVGCLLLVGAGVSAAAAAGPTADPTWGDGGSVTTVVTQGPRSLTGVALESLMVVRDRVWLSGVASAAGPFRTRADAGKDGAFLARYRSDGRLDTSFGNHGILRRPGALRMRLELALPSGEILANQWRLRGANVFELLRPDGSVDKRFHAVLPPGVRSLGGCDDFQSVLRQPDGKIVAVAGTCGGGRRIARLTATGAADQTFGEGGAVRVQLPAGPQPEFGHRGVQGIVLESSGSIVVAIGYSSYCCNDEPVVLERVTRDGLLDRSFGKDGVVTLPRVRRGEFAGMTVQPDGRLIVAALDVWDAVHGPVLFAVAPDGSLDTTWGHGGVAHPSSRLTYGDDVVGARIVGLPGGKIAVIGERAFARVNADGTPDLTFGGGGTARFGHLPPGTGLDNPVSALGADGKAVRAFVVTSLSKRDVVVERYRG